MKLANNLKLEICEALKDYKKAKEYVYSKERKGAIIRSIHPVYHNTSKSYINEKDENGNWKSVDCRRYRFNICSENSWNRMELDSKLKEEIENKVKDILKNYGIKYKSVNLDTYYPYYESRMEYASWIRCLDIFVDYE